MIDIKYKLNKYLSKYESEVIFIKKMKYAKKFLLYLDEFNKNRHTNNLSNLNGGANLKEDIDNFTSKLNVIKQEIEKVKPIYDLVKEHDNLLKLINPSYTNYTRTDDIIEYYSRIYLDIEKNFNDL